MISAHPHTWLFCGFAFIVELGIFAFLGHFLYKATRKKGPQWRWSSEDSRDMWMDVTKTMITASGTAAALLASLTLANSNKISTSAVANSVKTATVSLVFCVCVSMFEMFALARGHEAAKARYTEELHKKGDMKEVKEGPLSNFALCIILSGAFVALSSFFIGFLFLARIVWHI